MLQRSGEARGALGDDLDTVLLSLDLSSIVSLDTVEEFVLVLHHLVPIALRVQVVCQARSRVSGKGHAGELLKEHAAGHTRRDDHPVHRVDDLVDERLLEARQLFAQLFDEGAEVDIDLPMLDCPDLC